MAQETFTEGQFYASFEELGEAKVGERLAAGTWGKVGRKVELAKEWLRQKEQSRRIGSESEQTEIARSAKDAAWLAAESARDAVKVAKAANTRAMIALVISGISVLVTAVIAFLRP